MHAERLQFGEALWPTLGNFWDVLTVRDPSIFLSPRWTAAWLATFGVVCRPIGILWRNDLGRPAACALLSTRPAHLGPFRITRAYLNASGTGVGCEHNDVLALPEHRAAVLDDLVRIVLESGVDEFALVGVREELFRELLARWPVQAYEGHLSESPFVDLARIRATGMPYQASLSANTRAQIRRSIRLYTERFGELELRVASSREESVEWFGAMVALHEATWRARGERGAFADPEVREFHVRLLDASREPEATDDLVTDVVRVRFGSEVIGYLYNLRYRGRVSFYQSGLVYHGDNRLKPGLVAHALAIEHYLATGAIEYDFLGGEPESVRYKTSLSTGKRMLAWVQLPSPTYKMRAIRMLRLARRRARALLGAS